MRPDDREVLAGPREVFERNNNNNKTRWEGRGEREGSTAPRHRPADDDVTDKRGTGSERPSARTVLRTKSDLVVRTNNRQVQLQTGYETGNPTPRNVMSRMCLIVLV